MGASLAHSEEHSGLMEARSSLGGGCFLHHEVILAVINLFPAMFEGPIPGIFMSPNKDVRPGGRETYYKSPFIVFMPYEALRSL